MSETETEVATLRREVAWAHAEIEKLQTRLQKLECWLQEVTEPDGTRERRIFCNSLCVHPPGQPAGMRWELSANAESAVLVLHSGAGEELLQIVDTPDGRGPLMTFLSHDGTQTVQFGAGPHGGGVVRVANEEGTGLILLTTDGDAGRIGVAHAKTKALAALHTQQGNSGLEIHDSGGHPVAVVQGNAQGGVLGIIDPQGRPRLTAGITPEGHSVMKVASPGTDSGLTVMAGTSEVNLSIASAGAVQNSAVLRAEAGGVALNFWAAQQPVLHLATCQIATERGIAHGAMLRLTGTNDREIELNPIEAGRQFVLFGDEKLPLATLGAAAEGVQFILNDEIGMPKLQLFARDAGGVIFAHDSEHTVAATLPPEIEFDQTGEDDEED